MDAAALLLELYDRIPPLAQKAVDGVDAARLTEPPVPGVNTIAWLVWHMARVEDAHGSELLGEQQLWEGGDWAPSFGLEPDPENSGYGHTPDEVASVRPERPEVLLEYLDAVHGRLRRLLEELVPDDLDAIVDESWDPPVTMGVRLVSIAEDALQHAGQAAYIRGLLGA